MTINNHIPKGVIIILLFVLLIIISGCDTQSRGFALPPGNPATGKLTFSQLQCNHCHSVAGDITQAADGHQEISYVLGGEVTNIKTYGDLVTSIINPSHKISGPRGTATTNEKGESRMRLYNDLMTVQQLVNLTAYLQSTYKLVPPPYTIYYGP